MVCLSLDNTFKSAGKAVVVEKDKSCTKLMKGGILSTLSTLPSPGYSIWNPWNGGWRLMDSMEWLMDSMWIPWNFQMDSILFKSDLMPPQNSIQNSYVNIDIVLIIFT